MHLFLRVFLEIGGIRCGNITEFVGESGCGKSQFCLTMCVEAIGMCQDIQGGIIYVDTDNKFSAVRLLQLAKARYPDLYAQSGTHIGDNDPNILASMNMTEKGKALMSNIKVFQVQSNTALLNRLKTLDSYIIEHRIKLIVVDSIEFLFRKEFVSGKSDLHKRSNILSEQAALLKYLAETFHIPVVVTNQAVKFSEGDSNSSPHDSGSLKVALGNTWAHCVNTRVCTEPLLRAICPLRFHPYIMLIFLFLLLCLISTPGIRACQSPDIDARDEVTKGQHRCLCPRTDYRKNSPLFHHSYYRLSKCINIVKFSFVRIDKVACCAFFCVPLQDHKCRRGRFPLIDFNVPILSFRAQANMERYPKIHLTI